MMPTEPSIAIDTAAMTTALIGTFIAAVLSSAGYLYRIHRDSKRSARKVLYLLLEIRHAMRGQLLDARRVSDDYVQFASGHFFGGRPPGETDAHWPQYRQMIDQHIEKLCSTSRTEIEEKLLALYEAALMELAADSPVLAHRLRGKEKLAELMTQTTNYAQHMSEAFSSMLPEHFKGIVLETIAETSVESREDLITGLDSDVLLLAKACGPLVFRSCQKELKRQLLNPQTLDFSDMKSDFNKLIEKFVAKADAAGLTEKT